MATLIIPRFLALRFIVCAATIVEPEPDGFSTTEFPEPEPELAPDMFTPTSDMGRVQTFTHQITMMSLSQFSDVADLETRYKESMASSTGTSQSAISVSLTSIIVIVISAINNVASSQLAYLQEAFAATADVSLSAVVVVEVVSGGRRLEMTAERRLSSMQVEGSITAGTSNMVQDAQRIFTQIQNDTALGAEIANRTGGTATVQSSASFQLTMTANVSTDATLNANTVEAAVGQGLNGTAETIAFNDGLSPTASTTTAGTVTGTSVVACSGDILPRPTGDVTWRCRVNDNNPNSYDIVLHPVDSAKVAYSCSPQCKAPLVIQPSSFNARCAWNGSWITSQLAELSCVLPTSSNNDVDTSQGSSVTILLPCVVALFAYLLL